MISGSLLISLANIISLVLTLYFYAILIRALLSWVNPDPYNPVVRFIVRITEPVLGPFRRLIPPISGFDISPIVALLVIEFGKNLLVRWLYSMAGPGLT
ncbi:YggT family protein [Thermithiobacillus plumbiphilus]|uniref:YggT family protein n=1 Tax=Thermithiobacillus plumbiphilus TaxID=1729899 RepID=A0ABU9D655_9PROT